VQPTETGKVCNAVTMVWWWWRGWAARSEATGMLCPVVVEGQVHRYIQTPEVFFRIRKYAEVRFV
ncbi:MAG: hypothetical protein K8G78_07905, partial [Deltaproteobacteria bacterium]|nr:hypothetical protein [Candidatus Kapabacteria bacterium]